MLDPLVRLQFPGANLGCRSRDEARAGTVNLTTTTPERESPIEERPPVSRGPICSTRLAGGRLSGPGATPADGLFRPRLPADTSGLTRHAAAHRREPRGSVARPSLANGPPTPLVRGSAFPAAARLPLTTTPPRSESPMRDLLIGPLALAARLALVYAAGWLASAGLVIYDEAAGTVTLHIDNAAALLASGAVVVGALVWRKVAVLMGGKT